MRILIVKMSSMGDLIHTFPALTDAKRAYPHVHFDWVVEENLSQMPTWHPAVTRVIPIAFRRWRKQLLKKESKEEVAHFVNALRATEYDYVMDAQGLLKSALVACIAKGKRVGFSRSAARESMAAIFYQQVCHTKQTHAIACIRELLASALQYDLPESEPDFGLAPNRLPPVEHLPESPYLIFLHGTSRASKEWTEARWLALSQLAQQAGFSVCLPWGNEAEHARAERIASQNKAVSVLPALNIGQIGYVISKSNGVIGLDSGFTHLAAALKKPTLALYKASSPDRACIVGKQQTYLEVVHESQCRFSKGKKIVGVQGACGCFSPLDANYVWETFSPLIAG